MSKGNAVGHSIIHTMRFVLSSTHAEETARKTCSGCGANDVLPTTEKELSRKQMRPPFCEVFLRRYCRHFGVLHEKSWGQSLVLFRWPCQVLATSRWPVPTHRKCHHGLCTSWSCSHAFALFLCKTRTTYPEPDTQDNHPSPPNVENGKEKGGRQESVRNGTLTFDVAT